MVCSKSIDALITNLPLTIVRIITSEKWPTDAIVDNHIL